MKRYIIDEFLKDLHGKYNEPEGKIIFSTTEEAVIEFDKALKKHAEYLVTAKTNNLEQVDKKE